MASHLLALLAYPVGWLKGGHPERLAVTVLIAVYASSSVTFRWRIGDVSWASAVEDAVLLVILGRLALKGDRWWPLAAAASAALLMLTHVLTVLTPLTHYAAVSAQIGLRLVIDSALLFGVLERWLAGEPAVSDTAVWRRRRATP